MKVYGLIFARRLIGYRKLFNLFSELQILYLQMFMQIYYNVLQLLIY